MDKTKILVGLALAATLVPSFAFAANVEQGQYCRGQAGYTSGQSLKSGTVTQIIAFGDCLVTFRDTDLNAGLTRLNGLNNVSASTKQTLAADLNSTLSGLATIQGSLNADTSTTTAYSDMRTVYTAQRVYLLQLPRTWIYAAGDREITIVGILQGVETTLMTANNAASSTVQQENAPLFTDMTSRLSDATTQATNAENGVINLQPDQGNQDILASNAAAIKAARAADKAGQTDLVDARQDAQTIKANLGIN